MKEFNGIEIAEYRLVIESIFFSVFFVIGIGLAIFFLIMTKDIRSKDNTKNFFYELEARAETDERAKKRLEKLKRKDRKKQKEKRADRIFFSILLLLCVGIMVFSLVVGVIPGWTDYVKKDYVVYEGTIEVHRSGKHTYIKLEDGTEIYGSSGFSYDDKYGTVVYSKRSKITLGGQK